mgnify:CR=1 FL=1
MKENINIQNFETNNCAWINERYIANNAFDLHVEEIKRNGYTVLTNQLNADRTAYVRRRMDEIYDAQITDFGGEEALIEIGEHGLARNLLEYDEYFLDMIINEYILKVVRYFLGEYFILHQFNGNLNISGLPATSTPWHRDITFRDFTSSRLISMTVIWVIDEFNELNDGISILPGSQKHDCFPSFEFADKYKKKLYAKEGSIIILDSMFFHRSGFNNSGHHRRICQGMYSLPFMGQQISIPKTLQNKHSNDPFLRQFLGYNNIQQPSIYDWRKEKLDNKRKKLRTVMLEDNNSKTSEN